MQRLSQVVACYRKKAGFGLIGMLKLLRALLNPTLQHRMGFLKLSRHTVELVPERLQLVIGPYGDSLAQIASANARGTIMHCLNGHDHSPRQEQAAKEGDDKSYQEQYAGAKDRGIEGGEGLIDWQLNENQPV